ncbi:MAG: N-acetyl-gamma-glutamyl-phosphate reductase [Chloroflexi bacterium]|nr:MAG: N-acetyl-gamma-glutamyl-phosphate reductase [Phototrophicales bacterium]RMF80377.1 MAG: N-acetyl-gamma-glutamyl-phosphate reductase [Chloroflexota bacterium]
MYKVGVYGASGYAGQDLIEILLRHPQVEVIFATSNTYSGEAIPNSDLQYIPHDDAPLSDVDAVFLALPHKASAVVAAQALAVGVKVIDLSADFRLDTPERYEQWYKVPHPHPELLPTPYGLPEINRANIRGVNLVATPGCYPTTTLLGLYPLLKAHALAQHAPIIVDAKSGVSGAGRSPKPNLHFVEVFGNLSPYSAGRSHRHVGEIEQEIAKINGNVGTLIFTPHLVPVDRGLMASIYVTLNDDVDSSHAQGLYEEIYDTEPLVRVLPAGQQATLRHAVRKNSCTISLTPVTENYLHITSVTDNLRKGAASQAVQNFNLMMNITETTGLL